MSRKLIYVAGLLACFSCELCFVDRPRLFPCPSPISPPECVACLREVLRLKPLDMVAALLLKMPHLDAVGRKMFNAYNEFLGMLADPSTRQHLEELPLEHDRTDPTWTRARDLTHEFRDSLLALFFDEKSQMGNLTKMYGVF